MSFCICMFRLILRVYSVIINLILNKRYSFYMEYKVEMNHFNSKKIPSLFLILLDSANNEDFKISESIKYHIIDPFIMSKKLSKVIILGDSA